MLIKWCAFTKNDHEAVSHVVGGTSYAVKKKRRALVRQERWKYVWISVLVSAISSLMLAIILDIDCYILYRTATDPTTKSWRHWRRWCSRSNTTENSALVVSWRIYILPAVSHDPKNQPWTAEQDSILKYHHIHHRGKWKDIAQSSGAEIEACKHRYSDLKNTGRWEGIEAFDVCVQILFFTNTLQMTDIHFF